MAQVNATSAIDPAIRAGFENAYESVWPNMTAMLSPIVDFGLPAVSETNTAAYPLSAPHPKIWNRGEDVSEQGFGFKKFTYVVRDWEGKVTWHQNDERYDQTKSLVKQAEQTGANMARLVWRVANQIVTATTDSSLLPAIPNAPDGAALYSATDGASAARFGVSGGNIVTQTGTTGTAVQADLYTTLQRFSNMQDTEGQELWPADMLQGGLTIVHGPSMLKAVADAFQQRINVVSMTAAGAQDASVGVVAAGAKSNVILDAGFQIRTICSAKITGTKLYVFLENVPRKPLFHYRPPGGEMVTAFEDMTNSDRSRKTGLKARQWTESWGMAVFLPYGTIVIQ